MQIKVEIVPESSKLIEKEIKMSERIHRKSAVSVKIKEDLNDYEWVVYTEDMNIQNMVARFMSERGEGELTRIEISKSGRIFPSFSIPLCAAEFLKKNKVQFPNRIIFRRRKISTRNYRPWISWKEGKKTANEFLKKVLPTMKRRFL